MTSYQILMGYFGGEEDAARVQADDAQRALSALGTALSEVDAARKKALQAANRDIVALSLAIAERIVHTHVELDPETVVRNVRAALDELGIADHSEVHLAPQDVAAVEALLRDAGGERPPIRIVPDPSVKPGGARVVSDIGEVDATLAGQLASIAEAFKREVGGAKEPR